MCGSFFGKWEEIKKKKISICVVSSQNCVHMPVTLITGRNGAELSLDPHIMCQLKKKYMIPELPIAFLLVL